MRIQGRLLRPSTLAERRVLKSLGTDSLRVRRGLNPFMIVRHIQKIALGRGGDMPALRALLKKNERPFSPVPALPNSTPVLPVDVVAA